MAFVLVQHLDPVHKSLLVELLSKHTAMPVVQAEDGMAVAADHVFIIPPNATLTIAGGTLRVATPAPPREHRKPIDAFFSSLAEDQEENAVCIILAGTGSDGSLGLQTIKAHGGLTLAQAGFDETALLGMPSSAAANRSRRRGPAGRAHAGAPARSRETPARYERPQGARRHPSRRGEPSGASGPAEGT